MVAYQTDAVTPFIMGMTIAIRITSIRIGIMALSMSVIVVVVPLV